MILIKYDKDGLTKVKCLVLLSTVVFDYLAMFCSDFDALFSLL